MAGPLTLRRAVPADAAAWRRLWLAWQVHMDGRVPDSTTARAWDLIVDPGSGLFSLMAFDGRDALGFATASVTPFAWTAGPTLFLQDLFVAPEVRGRGVGGALLEALYAEADAMGASQVFWLVDETDAELQAFYARRGMRTPYLRFMREPWPW